MALREIISVWFCCAAAAGAAALLAASPASAIGVNYGTLTSHPLLPTTVVRLILANGIEKVKLFDADSWTLSAFVGKQIEVMVGIPNNMLAQMTNFENAKNWVKENVTRYDYHGGISIKYVAVGNEPFLESYHGAFVKTTFPALKNIQLALNDAGVGKRIKATVPLNADVYNSPDQTPVPSAGNFRADIHGLMVDMVRFLDAHDAPFVVNIYPFLSLYLNSDFPKDFAFFDGRGSRTIDDQGKHYTNVFDANYDTLVWSLKKAGVGDMRILVGEVGWPTDGYSYANIHLARRFYRGFLEKMANDVGTPMRPGNIQAYLFGLVDEDMKSIEPGNFERHWGLFTYDGKPKFPIDLRGKGHDKYLKGAEGVQYLPEQWCVLSPQKKDSVAVGPNMDYACSHSDCTALGYGSSCNELSRQDNVSYAFNMYFQMQDQDVRACDFQGVSVLTDENPSRKGCRFPVQIISAAPPAAATVLPLLMLLLLQGVVGA